jgi:hypothetical protein
VASTTATILFYLGLSAHLAETDDAPLFDTWEEAVDGQAPVERLEHRRWVRHRIRYRERLNQIAVRYRVEREDLVKWNRLAPQLVYPPKRRRALKVLTRRVPPPRFKVHTVAREGESWGDIATRFRVEIPDLVAWNWRYRRPKKGRVLEVWVDPAHEVHVAPGEGPEPPVIRIRDDARSIGKPQRGRIENSVQLPKSTLYDRGHPWVLWGSSHAVENVVVAIGAFRRDTGFEGKIVVGSMSRRGGRRLPPHVSHQSGRDVDIRLPLLPGLPSNDSPNPDEVDWYATWGLIKAFVDTGEASLIFLDIDLHRRVYEAARVLGVPKTELAEILMWPFWKGGERPVVRHADGHDAHIHVRIKCGPNEPRCKNSKRP